jgi:hypothetical protein
MKGACTWPVDKELSQQLARLLSFGGKSTYLGLLQAIQWLPELGAGQYVEGWVVTPDRFQVFPHSWIELVDRIVDPLRYHALLYYFPGVRFGSEAVAQAAQDAEESADSGEDGHLMQHRHNARNKIALNQSHQAARTFASALAEKMHWMRASMAGRTRVREKGAA